MIPDEELAKSTLSRLRVVDLRKELTARFLSTTGRKADLIERLSQHLEQALAKAKASTTASQNTKDAGNSVATPAPAPVPAEQKATAAPNADEQPKATAGSGESQPAVPASEQPDNAIPEKPTAPPAEQEAPKPAEVETKEEPEPPRRTSSVLDALGEEDDEDDELDAQQEAKIQKQAPKPEQRRSKKNAPKKTSGKASKRDSAVPMDREERSQEKRKKIIPKIAKLLMDNDKPKRKRSSVGSARRARMDEAERSRRPTKMPRKERESVKRISLKAMPRKGSFEDLNFEDLQRICEKRYGKHEFENLTIEIENEDAKNKQVDRTKDDQADAGNNITNALRIDGLVRPFTKSQLRELLEKFGVVQYMWLDHIKTHCYVMYKGEEESRACCEALDNLQWPEDSPKKLRVKFVEQDEAIEASRPKVKKVETEKKSDEHNKVHMKTLDELFRRTKAKPPLYWLPVTDEEIKERDRICQIHPDRRPTFRMGYRR